jgi:gliding motility-associated-like protein|tara:strand:+ start:1952 stop:4759 length:2808 start_codon:yes stop_codon:yes gene_type:complete
MNNLLKGILLLYFGINSIFLNAQNPGNLGIPNLTAWFKPDALPLGNVVSWTTTLSTLGGVTVTDAGAPFPQATNTPTGNISNYNTTIFFNANSPANLQSLENTASLNLLQNNTTTAQGTFFCAYYFPQVAGSSNNHMMLYNNSPHAIQFRNLGVTGRLAIGLSPTNSANATRNWTETNKPCIISYSGNRSSATSMKALRNDLLFNTSTASQSSGPTGLYFGNYPGNANAPYNGYIHEYIFYDRDLTFIEMRKVNTYLAIKYGVTLENLTFSAQGDYLATDGTTIWDASVYPIYHNNVIGIGRDDTQGLLQKQSHAFDDNYRVYVSNLALTNAANTGAINSDISYVTMGQTNAAGCGTTISNAETPAGIQSRLVKEWKVTNTNFAQPFNIDLKIDTCQTPGTFVGNVDLANLMLLIDSDDGNFINATAYDQTSGIAFNYANGYITVTGIPNTLIPANSTRYITIAYNRSISYFTGNNTICNGDSTAITINILDANGPIDVDYSDGTTTTTLTNVSNGDIIYLEPNTTTNYTVFGKVNFLDCCGSVTDSVFTLTVNPNPTVVANASSIAICDGDSTQLTGSGASTYVWDNGVTDGDYVSPTATTTYQVIGTNTFGCIDSNDVTVTVNPTPIVSANTDNDFFCIGGNITLTGSGATTYLWNNGVTDNVPFAPSATTTYLVAGANAFNCVDTASITITVYQLPIVQANASSFGVCVGQSATVTGSGSPATTYIWDNGVTDGISFIPSVTATYTVIGTDVNGCQNTDDVEVVVFPVEDFYLGPDTTICPQDGIILFANQVFAAYQWNTGITGPSLNVNTDGTFVLTVTDNNGCTYTDNQMITLGEDCFQTIYIPNAFTPNSDEFNSYLRTTGDNIDLFQITIFNRWGEVMFISNDINQYWDGTYNGGVCPDGVYNYSVLYTTNSGNDDKLRLNGSVTILR